MNEPGYTPMNIAAVAAMSAELDRMKASHQALVSALEWYVRHEDCREDDTYYMAGCNAAKAALKLAKGEA